MYVTFDHDQSFHSPSVLLAVQVRKTASEKLFLGMQMNEELIDSDTARDEVNALLTETDWCVENACICYSTVLIGYINADRMMADVTRLREIRNRMCDLLQVPKFKIPQVY